MFTEFDLAELNEELRVYERGMPILVNLALIQSFQSWMVYQTKLNFGKDDSILVFHSYNEVKSMVPRIVKSNLIPAAAQVPKK